MRVLYLGTPDFAAIPLEALARCGLSLVGVVTQPDRPVGRSNIPQPPPVKVAAQVLGLDIPILQPETLRDPEAIAEIAQLRPDVGVIAAYGEILRREVLQIPQLGYLNIHPSLLPRYRGPSPIVGAILAGDQLTGVTIMQLERKMDSGPILVQRSVPLPSDARTGPLTKQLFQLGAELLIDALPRYAAGSLVPVPQDEQQATYTALIKKSDGQIDWRLSAEQIERMTRAYDPWPGAQTLWQGLPFKVIAGRVHSNQLDAAPGTILERTEGAWVATGAGALELITVQPAGKRPLAASDWWRGQRGKFGARFGEAV